MKLPLKWLSEYVGMNLSPAKLIERLTLAGLEVAGVRVLGYPPPEGVRIKADDVGPVWDPKKIVIAKVLGVDKHPNADKLLVVTLEYGTGLTKNVVTGAPNLHVGDRNQKVILALSGSVLFDGHSKEKKLVELKPKELRGIMNDAMVCSAYELGIAEDHEGIIILEEDAPVGKPLVDYIGDIVLELELTPNLARCQSIIGVAREVAAMTDKKLQPPSFNLETSGEPIGEQVKVVIENPKLCARYMAMLIRGVRIGPSPGLMRWRLTYAGMRPINNVVDITNYVLLEWGQPLHAFDFDVLKQRAGGQPPTITVRFARAGEKLTTLEKSDRGENENVVRELTLDHLVIADSVGPIALAGIKGGVETGVTDKTTNILLESANFDPISIRRTEKHFNLRSEASVRFSKGIHPEIVKPAAERAADQMRRFAGGKVCTGAIDCYPAPMKPVSISLELAEVRKVLGVSIPSKEVIGILQSLEFGVREDAPDTLLVKTPPHRLDIHDSADLVEEIVRIRGYDKLASTLLADQLPEQHTNRSLVLEERVRDSLVASGLQEVITYSLTTPQKEAPLGLPSLDYVTLQNPISDERTVMRRSVLASVLEVAAANLKHTNDLALFEVGFVYLPRPGERLPEEPRRLALVLAGRRQPEFWGAGAQAKDAGVNFYDVKGIIETLAADLHLPDVSYRLAKVPYLHPARAAELMVQGKPVGTFGQLHPRAAMQFDLGERSILAGELDLEAILAAVPERFLYKPVPRFPAALRDVAVIVEEALTADQVAAEIQAGGGDLLRGIRLFDLYRGPSIPPGTKSLAYALTYQADDRTLTDKEVDKAHKKIEDRLKHVLKAQIRGQEMVK